MVLSWPASRRKAGTKILDVLCVQFACVVLLWPARSRPSELINYTPMHFHLNITP